MLRTRISILALAASLTAVAACGNPDATSKALDKTIESATENVGDVADDTANALGDAAEDLGEFVEDAAQDVGKAIDDSTRKESNAK
jgi:ABC-type glycerol-3-phosphate transport system substrate-binding protein